MTPRETYSPERQRRSALLVSLKLVPPRRLGICLRSSSKVEPESERAQEKKTEKKRKITDKRGAVKGESLFVSSLFAVFSPDFPLGII